MNGIARGGLILGFSAFVSKALGALYRIPLTNYLGAEGIGIYQTVFPFYLILLTISSTGIPNALSKLIAEGKNPQKLVYKSIIAFGGLGFIGSLSMLVFAKPLSRMQGAENAWLSYAALSPSVFIVSVLSVTRGYHQGHGNMKPTGLSQIVEQIVKLAVGLLLIKNFAKDAESGAFFACVAITASEAIALIFITFAFKNKDYKSRFLGKEILTADEKKSVTFSDLIRVVFPVTLTSVMLPLCRAADSFLVVNLIKKYSLDAVGFYGLYTGAVESIVGVPVSVCYGIAVSGLPRLSRDKKGDETAKILSYTTILAAAAAVATFVFAPLAIKILYGGLTATEQSAAIKLLKISSLSVFLLPLVQSTSLVLIGKDKLYRPALSLLIGLAVKIALTFLLVKNPLIGISGAAFSDIGCYLVATFLNLLYIIKEDFVKKSSVVKSSGV